MSALHEMYMSSRAVCKRETVSSTCSTMLGRMVQSSLECSSSLSDSDISTKNV